MHKVFTFLIGFMFLLLSTGIASAQRVTLSGSVTDKVTKEALPGVSITIKGKIYGTATNESGKFNFIVTENLPFTLVITCIGYRSVEQQISASVSDLSIMLEQEAILGQELVIAASRTPERILESPVSIERIGPLAIRDTPGPSFFDALTNLKGTEASTQSMTFKSLNTRGFNSNGNTRFNQFIDGMDNQAPGLNFSVGNIVGISDLDADNAELLPGASSALYGAGGTNGTLLMTSKSPFLYPGLSIQFKTGINHVDNNQHSRSPWQDMSIRYAHVWNNKFAFKTTISYLEGQDWQGEDYSNFSRVQQALQGGDRTDPGYDGVNIYGDEINATFDASAGLLDGQTVSRTGYMEKDLVNYNSKSLKTSTSLHYRISDKVEVIAQGNFGSGNTVYTGFDRYSLSNFKLGQYKIELKGNNFFIRGYTTQERSGDAYNATALGSLINEYWKQSKTEWFPQYAQTYNAARLGILPGGVQTDAQAHITARTLADAGRPLPGSVEFSVLKALITSRTIGPEFGARFNDKSNLYHAEGMYNFTNAFDNVVEVIAGASFRRNKLNSGGTIFDDALNPIYIDEFGAYTQIGKRLFDNKFKLTGSMRYDKNENFSGQFTPRVSGVWTVAENNNIRASYQTGFRNPTNQNQFIDLEIRPGTRAVGGLPGTLAKYNLFTNKGYTLASFQQFVAGGGTNPALLVPYTFEEFKPESVRAYEIGYKGLINTKLLVDVYYYYNSYKNFISTLTLLQNPTPSNPAGLNNPLIFSTAVNNPTKVNSQGWALGLDYPVQKFNLTGNVSFNKISNKNPTFVDEYNTPKYRYNLGISNREIFKNVGFNVSYRWQGQYLWQSTFVTGTVPAFGTVDGQISFKLPAYKSILKFGGSDLFNHYYRTSYGNPTIGGMYYVSLLFDQYLR